ncbi:MAG: YggS family pyridoxal phosphate-dependent enzyme [Bacteroidales bacterium]|nr:YggS family pyridoxal phosphate-dependent enzyme [Bacteroidales bacterium]
MTDIKANFEKIHNKIPNNVLLVAVSKTKPVELIMQAYNLGYRVFGENKVQELREKYEQMPKDIRWHMIGHLQSNKVKYIAPFVELIHAVDSFKLLKTINKEALKNNRTINFLFQLHVAKEESKFGMSCEEVEAIINTQEYKDLKNINPMGLMAMATNTPDKELVHNEFRQVKKCFEYLKEKYFKNKADFKELSMGMSQDFEIAIEEGSTMIRLGSTLFGAREYKN